jgi:endonuclease/exonuclease/phosphatase family metal-dependent hydrolase
METRGVGVVWATLLVAAACGGDDVTADAVPVRLLTYNIGNPDAEEPNYPLRLEDQVYEDYMGEQIRGLGADIVLHQEVLPPTHCATFAESDPAKTCYDSANREPPIRRILGPDYTIVCDARQHVECIGVHTAFGAIRGVDPGAFVLDGAATPPLPMESCVWADGECSDDYCDAESTVSAVAIDTAWGELGLVHVHPNAPGTNEAGAYTGAACRALQLAQVFDGVAGAGDAPLVTAQPTLIGGDFNLDPVRLIDDAEAAVWEAHVGPGQRFTDLTPVDENGDQHATRRMAFGLAIDHVLADRATGACTVHGDDYIGTDPGTLPLDEGFDWAQMPDGEFFSGRIDHFAISCELVMDLTAR